MPDLQEALRQSAVEAAYQDTPEGYRVLVERKLRTRYVGDQIRYQIRVERGTAPFADAFDAPDLPTARALLATIDLAGFDPAAAAWQPATTEALPRAATWEDGQPSRASPIP